MLHDIFFHEYFWLSFLPMTFLEVSFLFLFFERGSERKEPLKLIFLALLAGILAAIGFVGLTEYFPIDNWIGRVVVEELFKVFMAILAMELLQKTV